MISTKAASSRRFRRRRGLSLIEALISLAIAASLLTAVGVAYQGASDAIRINDEFFRASQAARVSINQVMAEVRKCESGVVDTSSLELTTSTNQTRTYSLDSAAHKLVLTTGDVVPQVAPLASNVTAVNFDTDGTMISMTVTVQVGPNQIILNGSAMPRRVMQYK